MCGASGRFETNTWARSLKASERRPDWRVGVRAGSMQMHDEHVRRLYVDEFLACIARSLCFASFVSPSPSLSRCRCSCVGRAWIDRGCGRPTLRSYSHIQRLKVEINDELMRKGQPEPRKTHFKKKVSAARDYGMELKIQELQERWVLWKE